MTKSISKIVATIYLAGIVATIGSNAYSQKVKKAQQNVTQAQKDLAKANADYLKEVANYKKESAEKIAANDKSAKEFEARIASEKAEAKADYKAKISALELKNSDMKKRLEDYKADGKDQWEKFKAEFSHDMDELGRAFKDLTVRNAK